MLWMGVGRYVGFTPMWERTICGFRAATKSQQIEVTEFALMPAYKTVISG